MWRSVRALPELTAPGPSTWQLDVIRARRRPLLGAAYGDGVAAGCVRGSRGTLWRTAASTSWDSAPWCRHDVLARGLQPGAVLAAAVQNILLDLFAPARLALGDPLALAAPTGRLRRAVTSRVARALMYPLVSSVLVSPRADHLLHAVLRHRAGQTGSPAADAPSAALTGCLFVLPMLTGQELLPWVQPTGAGRPGVPSTASSTPVPGNRRDDQWHPGRRPLVFHHPRTWARPSSTTRCSAAALMLTLPSSSPCPSSSSSSANGGAPNATKTAALDARLDREAAPSLLLPPPGRPAPAPAVPEAPGPGGRPTRAKWHAQCGGEH